MKSKYYPFALIISLCLFFLCVSLWTTYFNPWTRTETPKAQNALQDVTEAYAKIDTLTTDLQQRIAKMDEIIREYERISEDNRTFAAQLHDFGEIMDEVGKMEQEGYMEGVK